MLTPDDLRVRMAAASLRTRIDKTGGCWVWLGNVAKSGYPRLNIAGQLAYVHRLAYAVANAVSYYDTEHVHHKCGNKLCVRTDHLAGLTAVEHNQEHHPREMWCRSGLHRMADSAYVRSNGTRFCRACNRLAAVKRWREILQPRLFPPERLAPRACRACGTMFKPKRSRHAWLCGQRCRMRSHKRTMARQA